ncbi:MAG: DNA repair protein RecN [Nevskia sp.]|nr:DNA repair protein RecN [Nevskia sp.]
MLRHLHIRNLAIIDELSLDFGAGFSVLTGETGAGKSILIDALGLIIGTRAESTLVRAGCDKAEVAAEFTLEDCPAAAAWLGERELADGDGCTIRRVVQAEGRTRAFVNGSLVTAADLRALGESLVEVFGQNESQTLLRADTQRNLLDDYGQHPDTLRATADGAAAVQRSEAQIEALRAAQNRDPAQIDYLRFQLQELEALDLGEGELAALDAEHKTLANAGRLLQDGGEAQQLLYGGEQCAYDQVSAALNAVRGLVPLHADFGEVEALATAAQAQLREAADALRRLLDRLDLDPQRLAETERRLGAIHELARKHRVRADELPARHAGLKAELDALEHAAERLQVLEQERQAALAVYAKAAEALTRARTVAGKSLAKDVTARVRELGMPNASFVVALEPAGRARPSAHGEDLVRFDFSANPGQPPRALAKVASGGELSRVSLAIQVSLRQGEGAATMIFDEVDAGIGGATAEVVGRQLRALGARRQVLCVTHLAPVAAQGQHHFGIRKEIKGGATYTRVRDLDAGGRVGELARMLGGQELTPATQALAEDLLCRAGQ